MSGRAAFVVLSCLLISPSIIHASCGAASCPLDTRSYFEREKGLFRIGYEFEYIDQDQPRIGTHKASVGEISGHHDEQRTVNRVHRFLGTWAPTDRLSLDLVLPLISRSHRHIHNHNGGTEIIPEGWDFTDVGDLMVQTRYVLFKPSDARHPTLSGIAGVEFPTGKSRIANSDGDEAEPGITPGSASYDVLVGGASLQNFSMPTLQGLHAVMPVFFSVAYKVNGEGHENYKLGNTLSLNAGATYPVFNRVGWINQLNFLVREMDDAGQTSEEVEKTGGEYLYYSPGIQFRLTQDLEWSTIVQVPLHQRVNNIQLASAYNLQTGISYKFKI
jgi:hypothetical protein